MLKWRYWILLAIVMGGESLRQGGTDNFYTASVQDVVLLLTILLNWRRWGRVTYAALATAVFFVGFHSVLFGIPPQIAAFGARGLVYLAATVDILAAGERDLIPSKRAMFVLTAFWTVSAAYAVYQQVTGFRYHPESDFFNQAPMSASDTSLIRIPSFFYNFSTHAKFCLSGLLVLLAMLERRGTSNMLAGIMAASIVVGAVLSGQRAAVAVGGVVVVLFMLRASSKKVWFSLVVGGVAVAFAAVVFPLYLERAESAGSLERINENFIVGVPNAFEEIPLMTGFGMGRLTTAAMRFDREFETTWWVPGGLRYDGGEGFVHFALAQGGLPWLIATLLVAMCGLHPASGRTSRNFIIAYLLWGITHDLWGAPQPFVLLLLPMLGCVDLGAAAANAHASDDAEPLDESARAHWAPTIGRRIG